MPTYRANVSDKEQTVIEQAANDSAIRLQSFKGDEGQVGQTKMVKAYDGAAQAPVASDASTVDTSVVRQFGDTPEMGQGSIIGQHNDKPHRFETPGKA